MQCTPMYTNIFKTYSTNLSKNIHFSQPYSKNDHCVLKVVPAMHTNAHHNIQTNIQKELSNKHTLFPAIFKQWPFYVKSGTCNAHQCTPTNPTNHIKKLSTKHTLFPAIFK
jgi:hypothetical protein